jgi:acetyltransferase-like isoleucine patch superfamily enzyme
VKVAKNCTIIGLENIRIGDNVRIDGFCTLNAAAPGWLQIGSYVHIAAYCSLSAGEGIELCDFSGLSQRITIYSRSDDYSGEHLTNPTVPAAYTSIARGTVRLGRHVIVGSGSTLLPGVEIGEGSSVGAHSLVSRSLEPWGIYLGQPAKRLKARSQALLKLESRLTGP